MWNFSFSNKFLEYFIFHKTFFIHKCFNSKSQKVRNWINSSCEQRRSSCHSRSKRSWRKGSCLQCQFYPCPAECALEHYIMKTRESPILYFFSGSKTPPLWNKRCTWNKENGISLLCYSFLFFVIIILIFVFCTFSIYLLFSVLASACIWQVSCKWK